MASNMTKLTSLWKCENTKSVKGEYFKGVLGDCYILLFHNPSSHPKAPAFDLCTAPKLKPKKPKITTKSIPSHPDRPFEAEWGGEDEAYPDEGKEEREIEDEEIPEVEDEDTDTEPPF